MKEDQTIPFTLQAARLENLLDSAKTVLRASTQMDLSRSQIAEVDNLIQTIPARCKTSPAFTWFVPVVDVYNAFNLFQECGSCSELAERFPRIETVVAEIVNLAGDILDTHFSDKVEKRWFACAHCGKEAEMYLRIPDENHLSLPWEDTRMNHVKEFMEISHFCDKCWQEYVYGD